MKAIKIHGAAPDNSGEFRAAGTELAIGKEAERGLIDEKRAEALIKSNAASPVEAKGKAAS